MAAVTALAIGAGAMIAGKAVEAGSKRRSAKKQAKRSNRRAAIAQQKIDDIEKNRQDVINPYEDVTDLSGLITDLSGGITNPFENISVATEAAEFQAEQADIALANTLDTMAATGAGAGGATALAQAALASKKGIAASIEQQEVANQKLKAQGEQRQNEIKLQEAQRVQEGLISEEQRLQNAEVAGKQYEFEVQESRDNAKLARLYGQQTGQQNMADQATMAKQSAWGNFAGAAGGAAMNFATAGVSGNVFKT